MSKKIVVVITSHQTLAAAPPKTTGYDLLQLTHPLFEFENAGYDTTLASPQGGAVPMDENTRDIADPLNRDYLGRASFTHQIQNTVALATLQPESFDAILFVGGMGALWDFPKNVALIRLAEGVYKNGGVLSAVCHGTAAFLGLHLFEGGVLLKNRRVTGFSDAEVNVTGLLDLLPISVEKEIIKQGGHFSCERPWQRHVVIDENIVTGQNPASARGVGEAVVKLLRQKK